MGEYIIIPKHLHSEDISRKQEYIFSSLKHLEIGRLHNCTRQTIPYFNCSQNKTLNKLGSIKPDTRKRYKNQRPKTTLENSILNKKEDLKHLASS